MAEGGEARNHETDEVEAVVRAFLGEERWATMTTERREQERERMYAALDAVRCAQGRDTDAPERSERGEYHEAGWPLDRCGECGRKGGDGVLLLISDVTKHPPLCFECRDLWYPPARSPEGDPTVSWQQWNDEVNTRISVQIELADARAEIKRLGELLDGETK